MICIITACNPLFILTVTIYLYTIMLTKHLLLFALLVNYHINKYSSSAYLLKKTTLYVECSFNAMHYSPKPLMLFETQHNTYSLNKFYPNQQEHDSTHTLHLFKKSYSTKGMHLFVCNKFKKQPTLNLLMVERQWFRCLLKTQKSLGM